MSVELTSAPKGAKALASADPHGKKTGKGPDTTGNSGFSALMTSLSASEDAAVNLTAATSLTDGPLTESNKLSGDVTGAEGGAALFVQPLVVPGPVPTLVTATSSAGLSASVLETASGGMDLQAVPEAARKLALKVPQAALGLAVGTGPIGGNDKISQPPSPADTSAPQKSTLASATIDAVNLRAAGEPTKADMAQTSTVGALLAHKNAAQAQGMGVAPQDYKEVRASTASQSPVPAADASATLLAGFVSDFVRPQGRFGARPGFGQSGSSGFEGAFGQAMAATHRSDAVFEVPPASAVVADTAVAETVSYWASQGVQTAELTLDGFGDSPVEVSILLNGDQAQIDFRTDQEGVRQVLEAATAQLKELLSSQGLALAGVSVGTSGKGDAGGDRRSRQDTKQVTLVKADAIGSVATRAANPAVGRSLDLFV
jgi:flagellar hook-length control protein FliK